MSLSACCATLMQLQLLAITMQFMVFLIMVTHKQWCERGEYHYVQCYLASFTALRTAQYFT